MRFKSFDNLRTFTVVSRHRSLAAAAKALKFN